MPRRSPAPARTTRPDDFRYYLGQVHVHVESYLIASAYTCWFSSCGCCADPDLACS